MWGSDTFAMLVSSSSMNVAIVTVMAINHGLTGGAGTGGAEETAGESGVEVAMALKETVRSQVSHAIMKATIRSHMPVRRRPPARGPLTKGERTRQRILADTAALFNTRGYEGTSLTDLMAATGLKKGGIYRHFGSKEELAAEAFDYAWSAARALREPDVDQAVDPIGWVKAHIDNLVSRRPAIAGGCPILNTAIEADDGNPVLRARVARALRGWISRVEHVLAEARKKGKVRASADPKMAATVIVSTLEGALMISRLEKNTDALLKAQEHLNAYLDALAS
jgi:TetR/AcrR family transcriptional repressor of nem operon